MVGLQKGNNNGNRGGGNNKPYGMMLLLAFGAALLGVMMIHKLRERRIFNLLVKEKDHQLISLQLLLQKEREYTKEMKRKAEEMKTKIYSLRNQNMETERRILEMQSTIHSLKDERKILESALEEKQNAMKANRKKIIGKENNIQVKGLMESLKQKEAEIEDLKRRLESSVRRSSVGTERYLSNGKPSFNVTGISVGSNETREGRSKTETGELYESTNHSNGVNPLERGNGGVDASRSTVERETTGRIENTSESTGSLKVNGGNNTVNAVEKLVNTGDTDSGMRSAYSQEHTVARDEQMGVKNSEQDGRKDEGALKGGRKLEIADKSRTSSARMRFKYAKETQWKKLARNRKLVNSRNDENDETDGIRKRKIPVDNQNQLRDREEAAKLEDFPNAKLLKSQKVDDSKDVKNIPVIEDTVQHLERLQANEILDSETTGTRSNATKESSESYSDSDGVRQYENRENYGRDMKMDDDTAQVDDVKDEMQEEAKEDADVDNGIDKATAEFDIIPDLEENKEDYKEEIEGSEF